MVKCFTHMGRYYFILANCLSRMKGGGQGLGTLPYVQPCTLPPQAVPGLGPLPQHAGPAAPAMPHQAWAHCCHCTRPGPMPAAPAMLGLGLLPPACWACTHCLRCTRPMPTAPVALGLGPPFPLYHVCTHCPYCARSRPSPPILLLCTWFHSPNPTALGSAPLSPLSHSGLRLSAPVPPVLPSFPHHSLLYPFSPCRSPCFQTLSPFFHFLETY